MAVRGDVHSRERMVHSAGGLSSRCARLAGLRWLPFTRQPGTPHIATALVMITDDAGRELPGLVITLRGVGLGFRLRLCWAVLTGSMLKITPKHGRSL